MPTCDDVSAVTATTTTTPSQFFTKDEILAMFADGGTITWTPLSGTNFSNVQDRIVNDSKYNFTPNIGDIDTYQYATVPAGTIKGAQFTIRLEKDSGGDATAKINYFDGTATTLTPGAEFAPSDSFPAFFRDPWRKSIFTGLDWTTAELNAMRVGPKRTS